jgi:hypothetical protein
VRPGHAWQAWSLAPEIVLPLAAFALLYRVGWIKSRSSAAEVGLVCLVEGLKVRKARESDLDRSVLKNTIELIINAVLQR